MGKKVLEKEGDYRRDVKRKKKRRIQNGEKTVSPKQELAISLPPRLLR